MIDSYWNNVSACTNTFVKLYPLIELFNFYIAPSGNITSVDLTFNPVIGVVGNITTAICHAQFTVNTSGCILQFDYGFVTNEVSSGSGLDAYNIGMLSPVNISSAGKYTCTVSVIDFDFCTRNISAKTSAAFNLIVQCA